MSSHLKKVERARPLLGTRVSVHLEGLPEPAAHRAIDAAFAAIAEIHNLMSFHEPASDISRLNRDAAQKPVNVSKHTLTVLERGLEIAEASGSAFDFTIGADLVRWGFLPRPAGPRPSPKASWRDVELLSGRRVRFRKPLWIDVGGIAKGYAVDQGLAAMELAPRVQCCVNAGGDLRVSGPGPERVLLRVPNLKGDFPVVEIEEGSLASSCGYENRRRYKGTTVGPHVESRGHKSVGLRTFVTVVAESCMVADGLTKVVLARGPKSDQVLRRFGASAYLYGARSGWRTLGVGAS